MSLIEEVKKQNEESHTKWFERWYKKKNLENELKKSASKGYSGYQLRISDLQDDYLKRRLRDSRTIKCIEEKLGDGFHVKYHEGQGKSILNFPIYKDWISIRW